MPLYTFGVEGKMKSWCYNLRLWRDWRFSFGFRLPMPHRGFRLICKLHRV
jgi:hypothetical protein